MRFICPPKVLPRALIRRVCPDRHSFDQDGVAERGGENFAHHLGLRPMSALASSAVSASRIWREDSR